MAEQIKWKHNILYLIINLKNGKSYSGVHSTNDLNDYYFGSGVVLRNAIKKYGKKYFKKIILYDFKDRETAFAAEAGLIDDEMVNDNSWYNIKVGGFGTGRGSGWNHSEKTKKIISEKNKKYKGELHCNYNKPLSEETKKKIGDSNRGLKRSKEINKINSDAQKKYQKENGPNRGKEVIYLPTNTIYNSLRCACNELELSYGKHYTRMQYNRKNQLFKWR